MDLGPFAHQAQKVSAELTDLLLECHSRVNDAIMMLWYTAAILSKPPVVFGFAGKLIANLKQTIASAKEATNKYKTQLDSLPLNETMFFFFFQWLSVAGVIAQRFQDFAITIARDTMDSQRNLVEQSSPAWGHCISDDSMNMQTAKILLSDNRMVQQLPPPLLVRLDHSMKAVDALLASLGPPRGAEYEATRERTSLSEHALKFGRLTVSVAAALTVCASGNQDGLQKVLLHKQVLPRSLLQHIEGLLKTDGATDVDGEIVGKSSGGMKRGRSSGILGAARAKTASQSSAAGEGRVVKRVATKRQGTT